MVGTKAGGEKVRKKIYEKYGRNYYVELGRKGGSVCGVKKGFALSRERAVKAGAKGGKISRRGVKKYEV